MSEEKNERVFTVYRMNFEESTKEPIGQIVERRKSTRQNNHIGLLQLARKQFSSTTDEAVRIGVYDDWNGNAPAGLKFT
ncbi:MAG: hypothetical protein H6Q79_2264 [Deltaproteobacteria bacterium]|nr:hypothetical protein [Deltaproteobacteria bacterium]